MTSPLESDSTLLAHRCKILVADDDADLRALIAFTMSQAGFQTCTAANGVAALHAMEHETPDLVLLDINMPAPDGLAVCREIRAHSRVPIMMLTVRDQEEDLLEAFDSGADDYVNKPFSPGVLLARVRALLRRSESVAVSALNVGPLRLDVDGHILQAGTASVALTRLELKALQLLMLNPGRTVSAERLLLHVWGRDSARERRTLKQLIYRLRRKLSLESATADVLTTTPGVGYRLTAE
jgi:DNA-binding response OmpR family regulator